MHWGNPNSLFYFPLGLVAKWRRHQKSAEDERTVSALVLKTEGFRITSLSSPKCGSWGEAPSAGQSWTIVTQPPAWRVCTHSQPVTSRHRELLGPGLCPVYFPPGSRQAGLLTFPYCHQSCKSGLLDGCLQGSLPEDTCPPLNGPKSRAQPSPQRYDQVYQLSQKQSTL